MYRRTMAAAALAACVALASCSQAKRGFRDAPIDQSKQDNQAPFIVNEPNLFANLALKCLGHDLLIVTTREAAPVVAPDADLCSEANAGNGIPRVTAR